MAARNLNKWILITGASTGIGKVTANLLAKRGYSVLAGVRKEADAAALRAEMPGLTPLILDVTKDADIAAARALVDAQTAGAGLFALINNAGFNYNAAFEFTEEAKARAMMETNFFGLYKMSQALLPSLRRYAEQTNETSKLVNIASIGGLIGLPWEAFYHASKFAVVGLSESIRHEVWPFGVRVVAICPGGIKTPFMAKTLTDVDAAVASMPEDGRALYGPGLKRIATAVGAAAKLGSSPNVVARKIAGVLKRPNPPLRVLVGADAVILRTLQGALPESGTHGIVRSVL